MTSYKRFCLLILAPLVVLGVSASPAGATTINSNPVADAFVTPGSDGSLANNNYGGGGVLGTAASGKPQGEFQSVMRFNTAATFAAFNTEFGAGMWTIQSITLQLTAVPPNNAIFNTPSAGNFTLSWMQNDSWIEGTGTPTVPTMDGVTWNTLPGFVGAGDENLGTFAYNGATSGATTYTLTLSSGFIADVMAGNLVSLRLLSADPNVAYLFNSRSFGTVANRPVFGVTAVPEPGSCALAVAGFSLLYFRARSRRR